MTRWSRPIDQPFQSGRFFNYHGIKAGHDYRYQPASGEGLTARRGESCTAQRINPG